MPVKNLKEYNFLYSLGNRLRLIKVLGGCCVRCGFTDWRALQVDHVNNDGYECIKQGTKTHNSYALLKQVQEDLRLGTNKYQLLCANCNWIKRYENDKRVQRLNTFEFTQSLKNKKEK